MVIMNHKCKNGCSRWKNCAIVVLYIDDCPCVNCLVKVRCSHSCGDRKQYWMYVLGEENKVRLKRINDNSLWR